MTEQKCPPLPAGSIDFNAFHSAATKPGADLEKAMERAVVSAAPKPAKAPAKPSPSPTPEASAPQAPSNP